VALPAACVVSSPVLASIVAIDVLLLVQTPPDGVLPSVISRVVHVDITPVIADGTGFIVIVFIAKQPVGNA
jgi:hypothetical protein